MKEHEIADQDITCQSTTYSPELHTLSTQHNLQVSIWNMARSFISIHNLRSYVKSTLDYKQQDKKYKSS